MKSNKKTEVEGPNTPTSNIEDEEDDENENTTLQERDRGRAAGEFIHPVTVELVFDDGETIRHQWDGRSRWKKFIEIRPAKLVSAEVDPDNLLILDVDQLNNSIRLEKSAQPATKMITHLVFWLQNVLQLSAMVG